MARTTTGGLFVWDLGTDAYNHTQQAANWDLVQSYWVGFDTTSKLPRRLHTTSTVPGSGTLGDVVFLTAASGGFAANSLLRYDGSAYRPVGYEILPTVPVAGLFAGRTVMLSGADGGFTAWSMIRYDGSAWNMVGGWGTINNGVGALNIKGLTQTGDAFISDSARGFVLKDRTTGTNYRLFMNNGNMQTEAVT